MHIIFFILILLPTTSVARKIILHNRCPFTVWPGILGPGNPSDGGFRLDTEKARDIYVDDSWKNGKIWARTGCDKQMHCETGFCKNSEKCDGQSPDQPVTMAEFSLNGHHLQDFYMVSMVDGYNIPIFIEAKGGNGCKRAGGCFTDINQICPNELQVHGIGFEERVVGCKSGCLGYKTRSECCRGSYENPEKCTRSTTAQIFKDACPTVKTYKYDGNNATFSCQNTADYLVQFC